MHHDLLSIERRLNEVVQSKMVPAEQRILQLAEALKDVLQVMDKWRKDGERATRGTL